LAQKVVDEFCHNRQLVEDAVQEVQLALWEASALWNDSIEETFNHYAWLVMRRKLLFYLTVKATDRPRLSRREQQVMNALRQTLSAGQLISCTTINAISRDCGIEPFRLMQLVSFWYNSRLAITASAFIQLDELVAPEVYQDNAKELEILDECLKLLPEREQMIIRERFFKDPRATLGALSELLEVSIERVRQIEANSIRKLRKMLVERLGEP
jgi:RNA polymerase sigma factor (sigma-70 family)